MGAQGKKKLNANKTKKKAKSGGGVQKKGHKQIVPKKLSDKKALVFKQSVQKKINRNIESELSTRAKQVEEGKAFNIIETTKITTKTTTKATAKATTSLSKK